MIQISQTAAQVIKLMQNSRQQLDTYFRIQVQPGGCAGMVYTFALEQTPQEQDCVLEANGVSVVVAPESAKYLEGLQLDYAEDLMGGGFRFQNPHATSTCSCGHSFSVHT